MSEMVDLIMEETASSMDGAVAHTRREMATIRTGRANSAFVEKLQVEAYGVPMTLQELATFSVPEARQLIINPHDAGNVEAIERAIRNSDLGLSPSNDGRTLRLAFPQLTEERRKDLVKVINNMAEEGKGKIRGHRRSARKDLEEVEQRLSVIEKRIVAVLTQAQTEDDLFGLRQDMDRQLAPYRRKMTADQISLLEKQYFERATLEAAGVPRLSLFYLN